jgi:hypothetical protein
MLNQRYNFLVITRTLGGTLLHTPWRRAWRQGGLVGLLRALFEGVAGFNAWPFFVDARGPWRPEQLAFLLSRHGISSWGYGFAGGSFYFRVKLRQAHWAQYVLQARGVPLTGALLDERARVRQGAEPTPARPVSRLPDPTHAVNALVDRIAGI